MKYKNYWLKNKKNNSLIYIIDYKNVNNKLLFFIYNHNDDISIKSNFNFVNLEIKYYKKYEYNIEYMSRYKKNAIIELFEDRRINFFIEQLLKWKTI